MKVTITDGDAKVFVQMSTAEALRTIESLVFQIQNKDCNYGRYESIDLEGKYLTIAVMPEREKSMAEQVAYMNRLDLEKLADLVNHEIKLDDMAREEYEEGDKEYGDC